MERFELYFLHKRSHGEFCIIRKISLMLQIGCPGAGREQKSLGRLIVRIAWCAENLTEHIRVSNEEQRADLGDNTKEELLNLGS